MVSAHPLRLSTATAMVDCELLKIGKAEMVRVLHDEPELSNMFVHFLLTRPRGISAHTGDSRRRSISPFSWPGSWPQTT